jgi:predicted GH43/DUF377 family glycosyl hydrolase
MELKRFENNPILSPNPNNAWENFAATNPGAWYDEKEGKVYLLYRAAGDDFEHVIRLGLAISEDGYNFTRVSDEPAFSVSEDGWDAGCVEDPRVVKMGDWYYVTYAARIFPPGQYWANNNQFLIPEDIPQEAPYAVRTAATISGLAMTKDFKKWIRCGRITSPVTDDRDVALFPRKINDKFYMIHRPGNALRPEDMLDKHCIKLACSDDLLDWKESQALIRPHFDWEGGKVGANCPPIETPYGWLLLFHGVTREDQYYRLGAVLLDIDNPRIITHRTPGYIFEPREWYEIEGPYNGVCFPCGSIVKDNKLFVYYGGGDKYTGLATCEMSEILDYLKSNPWTAGG